MNSLRTSAGLIVLILVHLILGARLSPRGRRRTQASKKGYERPSQRQISLSEALGPVAPTHLPLKLSTKYGGVPPNFFVLLVFSLPNQPHRGHPEKVACYFGN